MSAELGEQILESLGRRDPPAAFVSELAATIRVPAPTLQLETAIAELETAGRVLVLPHAAPDVHLEAADLRVVASVAASGAEREARDAADAYWDGWLRIFLATHRCE